MFNNIDIKLLFVFACFMTLAQLLILLHMWKSRKTYPGFGQWILALAIAVVGMLLVRVVRNSFHPLISIMAGNGCLYLYQALIYWGVARYCGLSRLRLRNGINLAIVGVSSLLMGYFTLHDNLASRVVVTGVASAIIYGRIALEPHLGATRRYSIMPVLSAVMAGFGFLYLLRALTVSLGGSLLPGVPLPNSEDLMKVIVLASTFVQVTLVYCFIAMTDERVERELQESETRFRTLTDTTSTGIFVTRSQHFDQVNPAMSAITGYTEQELLTMEWLELVHPEFRSLVQGRNEARRRGETVPDRYQIRIVARDGEERWVDLTAGGITLDGTPAIVGTVFDITPHKAAEALLTSAKHLADAANHAKSTFLATMSHEIRTPLHILLGAADQLNSSELDPLSRRYAQLISFSGKNLRTLIDDLLDISRIEAGRMELHPAPFPLEGLAGQLGELFRAQAEGKGIALACRVLPGTPPVVVGDRTRLLQVLINLVGNALKFTSSGMVEVTMESNSGISFTVSDTGPGIPPDQRVLVFQPFSQIAANQRGGLAGTGLGLAIVAGLVEAMGGRIELTEREGGGSVFTVSVPLPPGNSVAVPRGNEGTTTLPPLRILAVDDIPENLELVRLYLASSPVELIERHSGVEALALLARDTFDCLLLDIQMPGMNGYEVVAALRSHESKVGMKRTPVVVISAGAFVSDSDKALESGCDSYLPRPFDQRELLSVIAGLTGSVVAPSVVATPHELAHLLPKVRARLVCCVEELNEALRREDFTGARQLGHAIKGVGMTYGLSEVARVGMEIEAGDGVGAGLLETQIGELQTAVAQMA